MKGSRLPHKDDAARREYHRHYYRRNKDKLDSDRKDWAHKNIDRKRASANRYVEENKTKIRFGKLRLRYGITEIEFWLMFYAQAGCCRGCLSSFGDKAPHVDHDHHTGRVRGLLCGSCNRGIGYLRDDPEIMRRLIEYLSEHDKPEAVITNSPTTPEDLAVWRAQRNEGEVLDLFEQ